VATCNLTQPRGWLSQRCWRYMRGTFLADWRAGFIWRLAQTAFRYGGRFRFWRRRCCDATSPAQRRWLHNAPLFWRPLRGRTLGALCLRAYAGCPQPLPGASPLTPPAGRHCWAGCRKKHAAPAVGGRAALAGGRAAAKTAFAGGGHRWPGDFSGSNFASFATCPRGRWRGYEALFALLRLFPLAKDHQPPGDEDIH